MNRITKALDLIENCLGTETRTKLGINEFGIFDDQFIFELEDVCERWLNRRFNIRNNNHEEKTMKHVEILADLSKPIKKLKKAFDSMTSRYDQKGFCSKEEWQEAQDLILCSRDLLTRIILDIDDVVKGMEKNNGR